MNYIKNPPVVMVKCRYLIDWVTTESNGNRVQLGHRKPGDEEMLHDYEAKSHAKAGIVEVMS